MPDLHSSLDYRDYLRALYEERKTSNPLYSYRMWGRQLNVDPAQLFRILSKDLHLPLRHLDNLLSNLKLPKSDTEYFRTLVLLGRAKTEKEKKNLVVQLLGLKDIERKTLTREQYLFFHDWYHTTIRSLIGADAFNGDFEALGKKIIPPISGAEVEKSLQLQVHLGLIRLENGKYFLGEAHLSTEEREVHQAIRSYQSHMLEKGKEALKRFSKQSRDFSNITFAVDKACADDISTLLLECRRQIQRRIDDSGPPDRVLNLSLSLFPTAYVGDESPWQEIK